MFLELNPKDYQSSRKEKESCRLAFPSSTNREIRNFHDVVVTCKVVVLPIKTNCFLPFSLPSPSSLLKLPIGQFFPLSLVPEVFAKVNSAQFPYSFLKWRMKESVILRDRRPEGPKAQGDDTFRDLHNSSYQVKGYANNFLVIPSE